MLSLCKTSLVHAQLKAASSTRKVLNLITKYVNLEKNRFEIAGHPRLKSQRPALINKNDYKTQSSECPQQWAKSRLIGVLNFFDDWLRNLYGRS